jgi:hypothetical protein
LTNRILLAPGLVFTSSTQTVLECNCCRRYRAAQHRLPNIGLQLTAANEIVWCRRG